MRRVAFGILLLTACTPSRSSNESVDSATSTTVLRVGAAVPVYRATTLRGTAVAFGDASDSVTLVNAWATWCTSCREEMADLEELHRSFGPRGVRVIAVSLDAGSESLVRRFVERERLTFPVVHDRDARLQSLYQIGGVPSTYLIGRDGRLLWSQTGGLHGAVEDARRAIGDALTAEKRP